MSFNIRKIDGAESDVEYANKFVGELMAYITTNKENNHSELAAKTTVHLWNMLTTLDTASFMVENDPEYGDAGYELLQHVFFEDFAEILEDPSTINNEDISMSSPRKCAMSFLRILAVQLLNFTPLVTESIEKQLIRQIANTFNGQNRFGICFKLIGYKGESDEDHEFTGNLSSYILV